MNVRDRRGVQVFPTHRGFTLVELLVVIAIISALAGLLLPTLEEAINSARRIHCAGNLRQWGVALDLYANNFNDWMPSKYGGGADYLVREGIRTETISELKDCGITPDLIACPNTPYTSDVTPFGTVNYYLSYWNNESYNRCIGYTYYGGVGTDTRGQDRNKPFGWYYYAIHGSPKRHVPTVNRNITMYVNWYGQRLPARPSRDGVMTDVFWERRTYVGHTVDGGSMYVADGSNAYVNSLMSTAGGNVLYAEGHVSWVITSEENYRWARTRYVMYY